MKEQILHNARQLNATPRQLEKIEFAVDKIGHAPEMLAVLERYERGLLYREEVKNISADLSAPGETLGVSNGMWAVVAMLHAMEQTKQIYAQRGIAEDILWDTFAEMLNWAFLWEEDKMEVGDYGMEWIRIHLQAIMFRLGRLQYEFVKVPQVFADAKLPEGVSLNKGDPILTIHIPGKVPLKPEDCLASYRQAAEFFPKHFPDIPFVGIKCTTWLLDPRLKFVLPEDSNILQFAAGFYLVEIWDELEFPFRFIFHDKPENVDKIVPKTSLERKVIDWVKRGNTLGLASGFMAWDWIGRKV